MLLLLIAAGRVSAKSLCTPQPQYQLLRQAAWSPTPQGQTDQQYVTNAYLTCNFQTDQGYGTEVSISTKIKVIDCNNLRVNPNCIYNSSDLDNNYQVNAHIDLYLHVQSAYIPLQCDRLWSEIIHCGNFIELHRPFELEPLVMQSISSDLSTVQVQVRLNQNICAGSYHVWYVQANNGFKVITGIKRIYVTYPTCH